MQSGTRSGPVEKSSRVWDGTGTRRKGRLSPASGADFHDCVQARANKEGPDAVRRTAAIMPGKEKSPGMAGGSFL